MSRPAIIVIVITSAFATPQNMKCHIDGNITGELRFDIYDTPPPGLINFLVKCLFNELFPVVFIPEGEDNFFQKNGIMIGIFDKT